MPQRKVSPRVSRYARFAGATALALSSVFSIAAAPAPKTPSQAGPDDFIVVLKDGVDSRAVAAEHTSRYGASVRYVYQHALKGYAARASSGAIGAIAADGRVAYVERDQKATTQGTTQTGATWGLDRIDQRLALAPSDTSFEYTYTTTGAGVSAYIIDTGIRLSHAEFGGRAVTGFDAVDGGTADDCNGHGTHVAGTVGGATVGVAKSVKLVAVRVLDCAGSGTWSGVIAGIDWAAQDHKLNGGPAVANLSLGGGASTAVDTAVKNLISYGVATAVAAGNGNIAGVHQDACRFSPARVPEAMTVSATDRGDVKATWANYGNCVDWFAPGVAVTSAWFDGDAATHTISGTSMATPHTAGVAALYLQANPAATPAAVRTALYSATTQRAVKSSRSQNNNLLFTSW